MKKYLLPFAVIAIACSMNNAKAQAIVSTSADGMEVWADDPANTAVKDPNTGAVNVPSWETLNPFTSFFLGGSPQSVFKDSTIVYSGSYAAKIVSVVLTPTSYNYIKSAFPHDTLAMMMSGTFTSTPSLVPGVPFTTRVSAVNFEYQYFPQNNAGKPDTAYCLVTLSKSHVQIGSGGILMNAASSWTAGTVPITYTAIGNPDSITVVFTSSSYFKPAPGSILYVDAITTTPPLGVNEMSGTSANISVYPNPASSQVTFRITGQNAHSLKVYDVTGKEVNTYTVKDNNLTVNTSGFASGLYIYQAYDMSGALLKVGKFNIER